MRTLRQLLRQPMKTVAGILLNAVAVAVLCISFAQTLAANNTSAKLLETYMTVALPTNQMRPEHAVWVNSLITDHPELVSQDIRHGLASAYIPDLTPDNFTQHKVPDRDATDRTNELLQPYSLSYDGAMLEVEWESISQGEILNSVYMLDKNGSLILSNGSPGYTSVLTGKVIRAIGLQKGYYDPTGYTINVQLITPTLEYLERLNLQRGQRYLIYGSNYHDLDWELRDHLAGIMVWRDEETLPEWDISTFTTIEGYHGTTKYKCRIGDLYHGLSDWEMKMFRTITLTVNCTGAIDSDQAIPSITPLEGTAEELLSSEAGKIWAKYLYDIDINCHSFPIICTNNIESHAGFALNRASISHGRGFTNSEIQSGARVCVISDSLARAHNLHVGDKIELQYFVYALNSDRQAYIHDGYGIVNPVSYTFHSDETELCESLEYEIVGLYEQTNPWGSVENDHYAFTPNTIFVPHDSVTGTIDYSMQGQFMSLVLHSDKLLDTQMLVIQSELDEIFEYYDNGYNMVAASLAEFQAAAKRILPIGVVVYIIVIALYLFLFPARERRSLALMDSVGAGKLNRVMHIVTNATGISIPGSILGTLVAIAMWGRVAKSLGSWMDADIIVELNSNWLWLVAGVQATMVFIASIILGIIISNRVNPIQKN